MSYQLTVLYHQPLDPVAFDEHYESRHAPLAARIPGLRSYTTQRPVPGPDGDTPAEYLVAMLVFDDEAAYGTALESLEGQAAVEDVGNFSTGGATMLTGEVTTVV